MVERGTGGVALVARWGVYFSMAMCLSAETNQSRPGLVGIFYGDPDFTRPRKAQVLTSLDLESREVGAKTWSGSWEGFVIAPITARVRFDLLAQPPCGLTVGRAEVSEAKLGAPRSVTVAMRQGQAYPIGVKYSSPSSTSWTLGVRWSWPGKEPAPIPAGALMHSAEQAAKCGLPPEPAWSEVDFSSFLRVPTKNVVVCREAGRFYGWPANGGCWIWNNEILVAFTRGYYSFSAESHSIDESKPRNMVFARSGDGGETWTLEEATVPTPAAPASGLPDEGLNFAHPDLAIRARSESWWFSLDRGKTWSGRIDFPFKQGKQTARTDYQVLGPRACLFFLSEEKTDVKCSMPDRSFCTLTVDGGKSFEFTGWLTTDAPRSVMSSTVRFPDGALVSALRRRQDTEWPDRVPAVQNWIEAVRSVDQGKSWQFLSRVAKTDRGLRNGNPPSLVRLADGRLCVTYAFRGVPYGIRARISADQGRSWSNEILLRDDGATWDIGYTRTVARPDGKIVTIYYYATRGNPEQGIEATIWEPPH